MKKKLLFLLTPALLLSVVSCGGTKLSTSSPNTSPTPTQPTTSTTKPSTSPTNSTGGEFVMPETVQGMHEAVSAATASTMTGFIAKAVGIEHYPGNTKVNVYLQNGDYGFRAINVPLTENIEVGKTYKILAYGAARPTYVGVNLNTEGWSIEEVSAVEASPKAWNKDVNLADYTSGSVTGTGTVTEVTSNGLKLQIGNDVASISWLTSTDGGVEVATKVGTAVVGQEVTFTGCYYTNQSPSVSILDKDNISLNNVTLDGTVARQSLNANKNLQGTVTGNTLAFTGEVGWSAKDPNGKYEAGNVTAFKVTKHANLSSLSQVTLKVSGVGIEGEEVYTNEQLVAKKMLTTDGLVIYTKVTEAFKGQARIYKINWGQYILEQTVTIAYAADLTLAVQPSEALHSTAVTVTNDGVTSTFENNELVVGESGQEIALVKDKGNVVYLELTAPTGYVQSDVKLSLTKGEDTTVLDSVEWADLTTEGDKITLELVFAAVTDEFVVSVVWKNGVEEQAITVDLATGVTLEVEPTDNYLSKITFKSTGSDSSSGVSSVDNLIDSTDGTVILDSSTTNSKVYQGKTGLKFGSSSVPGQLTLTLSQAIKKVRIGTAQYGSDAYKLFVGTKVGTGTANNDVVEVTITNDVAEYEFDEAVTTVAITCQKRIYVLWIELYQNN